MSRSQYAGHFCSMSALLGSPTEAKRVCCVLNLVAEHREICCSDGEVVVLPGKSVEAAQLCFPLRTGG